MCVGTCVCVCAGVGTCECVCAGVGTCECVCAGVGTCECVCAGVHVCVCVCVCVYDATYLWSSHQVHFKEPGLEVTLPRTVVLEGIQQEGRALLYHVHLHKDIHNLSGGEREGEREGEGGDMPI